MSSVFFAISLWLLLLTYQKPESVSILYYASLCLGCGSILWSQMLWIAPLVWLLSAIYLQNIRLRSLTASLLGLLTPYWLAIPAVFYFGLTDYATAHFCSLVQFAPITLLPETSSLQPYTLYLIPSTFYLLLAVAFLVPAIHFIVKPKHDKIKMRMTARFHITLSAIMLTATILQPQHHHELIPLTAVTLIPMLWRLATSKR